MKIRGYRIELGEIESQLRACGGVREAVVLAREDVPGDKRLVAYYTVEEGAQLTVESLKSHLQRTLASYMVPAAYVPLSALPLTVNGKLDRKGLPAPDDEAYNKQRYEPPVGAIETALARIWSEVLRVERVGRRDNFFELGANSLSAIKLIGRVSECLATKIQVQAVFRNPGFQQMAQSIERLQLGSQRASAKSQADFEDGVI